MEGFKSYLMSRHISNEKKADFYVRWVAQFYRYSGKIQDDGIAPQDVERYLNHLSKRREDWQVKQAAEAIELYLRRKSPELGGGNTNYGDQWKIVTDDMQNMLRLKHRSVRTERTYLGWVRTMGGQIFVLDKTNAKVESSTTCQV